MCIASVCEDKVISKLRTEYIESILIEIRNSQSVKHSRRDIKFLKFVDFFFGEKHLQTTEEYFFMFHLLINLIIWVTH